MPIRHATPDLRRVLPLRCIGEKQPTLCHCSVQQPATSSSAARSRWRSGRDMGASRRDGLCGGIARLIEGDRPRYCGGCYHNTATTWAVSRREMAVAVPQAHHLRREEIAAMPKETHIRQNERDAGSYQQRRQYYGCHVLKRAAVDSSVYENARSPMAEARCSKATHAPQTAS